MNAKRVVVDDIIPPPQIPTDATEIDSSIPVKLLKGIFAAGVVAVPLSLGVTVIDRSVTLFSNGSSPSLGKVRCQVSFCTP